MQVIEDTNTGGRLGAALGNGLNQLAQYKLEHISKQYERQRERSEYAKGLAPLLGNDTANFLANLGPDERKVALQNIGALMQLQQQPGQQQGMQGMQALQSPQTQFTPEGAEYSPVNYDQMRQAQQQPQQPQPNDRAKLIEDIFTSPHEKREREKLGLKKQQIEGQFGKETREFSKPYIEKARAAKANLRDYEELIKLADSGKLRSGNTYQLMSKLGLQDFGRNGNTQTAEKLIARLAQNVNGVFGSNSRVTNFLEQTFQRSLPSLRNTPEGIKAISIINMAADKGSLAKDNIRKEVLRENGGRLTADVEDQIENRSAPIIDQLDRQAFRDAQNAIRHKVKGGTQAKVFNDLPPANQYVGKKIRDKQTGQILVSNGSDWVPGE